MSTFYLLPPRPLLAKRLSDYLELLLPGLRGASAATFDLTLLLDVVTSRQTDVFVVHREDLPAGESPARALADGFGAEAGDDVVEVSPGNAAGEWTARRWRWADDCPKRGQTPKQFEGV
jgi:hypothetical protein